MSWKLSFVKIVKKVRKKLPWFFIVSNDNFVNLIERKVENEIRELEQKVSRKSRKSKRRKSRSRRILRRNETRQEVELNLSPIDYIFEVDEFQQSRNSIIPEIDIE